MKKNDIAYFGGGCFWCTEAIFSLLRGVISVTPGYAGGKTKDPTYEQVCSGNTGHAEVIKVTFDSSQISYRDLVDIFFHAHDPTTLNRQGNDFGTQYRSVIFYTDEDQRKSIEQILRELHASGEFQKPVVTEVTHFATFFPAEAYHKRYYERYQFEPYCQLMISPKLAALRKKYALKLQ
jgi:peptide-methionine (S)-S-oxide reductase